MTFKMTVESIDKIAGQTILNGHGNMPTYSGRLTDGVTEVDVLPVFGVYTGIAPSDSVSVNMVSANPISNLIGKELRSIT